MASGSLSSTESKFSQAWSPLIHPLFRAMWIASLVSNIGTWMQTVGAAWLMTMLNASPLLIGLVQTANALPVFLLGLPAGAWADMMDRRKLLLFTQTWMLAAAGVLGVVTVMGVVGPGWLLAMTFALGLGSALNGPAWTATIPELVPREELAAAVALNSVGFNLARAMGPALGGLVLAASNAGVVFLLNAVSFLGVIVVLWMWRSGRVIRSEEGLRLAMTTGLQYIRSAPLYHAVLIRTGIFTAAGSALWAMLPVVASENLHSSATGYGLLLGSLGVGSAIGAAALAPLRHHFSPDHLVTGGVVLFGISTAVLALVNQFQIVAFGMMLGGIAWVTVMSTFSVCAQLAPPDAVRARALAVYLLVFQAAMAVGSALWGALSGRVGVRSALLVAAASMLITIVNRGRLTLAPKMVSATEAA